MNAPLNKDIEAWEGEGGAASGTLDISSISMRDKASQVKWAQRIKRQVESRVATSALTQKRLSYFVSNPERMECVLEDPLHLGITDRSSVTVLPPAPPPRKRRPAPIKRSATPTRLLTS